jgi:hypothetical protein
MGGSFPEGQLPEREADHSPSVVEVKNLWKYAFTLDNGKKSE